MLLLLQSASLHAVTNGTGIHGTLKVFYSAVCSMLYSSGGRLGEHPGSQSHRLTEGGGRRGMDWVGAGAGVDDNSSCPNPTEASVIISLGEHMKFYLCPSLSLIFTLFEPNRLSV